ncbi:MAG: NfeD family protein [Prevotella ruminicola]|uniref:NfeD family protein n=1 Tax=Xylanibacter ruminicola TaxID=839 RepID=A0A9D5P5H5_XYLRU|nr:NfeD family protein [Xylanibacter ruminicola]
MIDYIMQHLWQMWAIVAIVCLILELTAGDFFIICFAIGAVPAAIVAALGAGTYYQIVVFAVVSLVSLFYVRPFAKRYLHRGEDKRISNADALLGRQGRVVETIQPGGFGRVQIDGDIWKATAKEGSEIAEGANVVVVDRASTIITVEILKM